MNFPSLKEITTKAKTAFQRFPITLTWAIVSCLFIIGVIEVDSSQLYKTYEASLLTMILGISWFICVQFLIEQFEHSEKWEWLKVVVLALLIAFYFHLPDLTPYDVDPVYYIRFTLYIIGGHLFLFFAPFVFSWNKEAYWNYLKSICIAIGRSLLFSGVLFLGLALALTAMEYLFEFEVNGKRYGQLFVFCLGIVNTWTYLSDFPKDILVQKTINYNKALEVFVKYILIPLVILYLIILYAYTIKIVFAWNLPKGWVSYLVTALAFLGFSIQVMINPIQKRIKSWTINRFYPWFYILLLPLIVLLFIAIFTRIGDYGITENRYFILALTLCILGNVLYILFSKNKRLIVLPICLFLIAILSSFGFWSVFSVSKNSQIAQFKKVYSKVVENKNIATNEEHKQLGSILEYLYERKSISKLDDITGISIEAAIKDTTLNWGKYYFSRQMLDSLGIELDPNGIQIANNLQNNYYYYDDWKSDKSYSITGYDDFISLSSLGNSNMQIGDYNIKYSSKRNELYLVSKKTKKVALFISMQKKLKELASHGENLNKIDKENFILEITNDSISTKLIFHSLSFYLEKDSVKINDSRISIFLKQH
ncbi:MAG: DUF4153 domain-containing protein [Cellulophaga sp.]